MRSLTYTLLIGLLLFSIIQTIGLSPINGQTTENLYLRDRPSGICGSITREQLIQAEGNGAVTNTILTTPDLSHSINLTETSGSGNWLANIWIETPAGGGPSNTARALVTRQNISCSITYTMIDVTLTLTKGTTQAYVFNNASQPEILFQLDDTIVIEIFRVAGNQIPILHYNGTIAQQAQSFITKPLPVLPPSNDPITVQTLQIYSLNNPNPCPPSCDPPTSFHPRFINIGCVINVPFGCIGANPRHGVFQDTEVRINVTVTDQDGLGNISVIHVNFNATNIINVTISWFNDPNASPDQFLANTTEPTIIENLRMENITFASGLFHNITFIFSFSEEFGQGYHSLYSVNASDIASSAEELLFEKWIIFFVTPSIGGGGVSALSLAPIGPQIMLAFILVGLLALGQSNPWFVLGGWVSMAMAFGMALSGQIYVGLGSSDNLLTFNQAFPESFSIWLFRFFIIMQFVYPIRILVLVYERLIRVISSLKERLG